MENKEAIEYLLYMKHNVDARSPMDIAIDTAIESLKAQTVNRWIPCSERMPKDNCYTLVAVLFDEIYEVYIAAFRGDGWHTVEGYVTHWMPLPEPPEGGDEDAAD